ncbi:MAG: hypothetical protein ACOY4K_17390 [Pseudomonadota bacterium]
MKFSIVAFVRCLLRNGHEITNSKSRRGYATCVRCGYRRKWR